MSLQEFKCPNCVAPIEFDAGQQEMTCPYCESVINIDALIDLTEDLATAKEPEAINWGYEGQVWEDGEQEKLLVYSCRSCAGEILAEETLGATSCPFCGNRVVITSKFSGDLKPDILIPFKKTQKEAIAALKKHYLGKKLLPKVFKDTNHIEEIKGVYVPFWLFDANAQADIEYRATKVAKWSDSEYDYTETSFYRVMRNGEISFEKVPVDGSEAIDDVLMQSLEPFNVEEAIPFKTAYLAGFFANKYDVDADSSEEQANMRIKNSTENAFADTVQGYASIEPQRTDIQLNEGRVLYALLPVWFLSTIWQDKSFTFAMNGQTGKFVGDLPLDKGAYWLSWLKSFGISAAVFLAVSLFFVGRM